MSERMDLGLPLQWERYHMSRFSVSSSSGMEACFQSSCVPGLAASAQLGLSQPL